MPHNNVYRTPFDYQLINTLKLHIMQLIYPTHKDILQKVQELKRNINTNDFCKMHGISKSKLSRFPSDKFIEELKLFDYMVQFYNFNKD